MQGVFLWINTIGLFQLLTFDMKFLNWPFRHKNVYESIEIWVKLALQILIMSIYTFITVEYCIYQDFDDIIYKLCGDFIKYMDYQYK